jgi:hypothetical protein
VPAGAGVFALGFSQFSPDEALATRGAAFVLGAALLIWAHALYHHR